MRSPTEHLPAAMHDSAESDAPPTNALPTGSVARLEPAELAPAGPATTAPKAPRRPKRLLLAIVGLVVVLAAGGTARLAFRGRFSERSQHTSSPVEAEPVAPPPPIEFALDSPVTADAGPNAANSGNFATRVDRIPGLAAALAAEGSKQADGLIVLPGRQAKAQSDSDVRHERWEIRLPPDVTLESYARQLDYFGIELGIIGGADEVVYLSHLADPQPKQRTGAASREGRLYMTWQRGGLAEADRKIAAHAKVNTKGKIIAMFCPPRIEKELAELERAAAKAKKIDIVQKTVFGVLPEGQGFKFYVIQQQAGGDAAEKP